MMQGDAYSLPIVLRQGELLITPEMVLRLEITIGNLTRTYPGVVRYDEENGQWLFPLTQEQTFAFKAGRTPPVQARIKFNDESVVGAKGKTVTPTFASQEVLPDEGYNCLSSVTVNAIPVSETDNEAGGVTLTIGA